MADTKHGEIDKSHEALSRGGDRLGSPRRLNPFPCIVSQPSASSRSPEGLGMGSVVHWECMDWDGGRRAVMSPLQVLSPA